METLNITNKDIDESLRFEVTHFSDTCLEIYKNMIEENFKKSFDTIKHEIDSGLKSNIMKKIGGDNMYDYSKLKRLSRFMLPFNSGNLVEMDIKNAIKHVSSQRHNLKEFYNFVEGEFIVIFGLCMVPEPGKYWSYEKFVWITNFGNIMIIVRPADGRLIYDECMIKHNCWIPIDYIGIFNTILLECNKYNDRPLFNPTVFVTLLKLMKDTLYNRKFVPLYTKDIINENDNLRSKHNSFETKVEEFDKREKEFFSKYQHHIDLIEEKNVLKQEREKLKRVALKLRMEKEDLEKEKAKLKAQIEKLETVDIDKELVCNDPDY